MSESVWTEYRPEFGISLLIVSSLASLLGLVGIFAGDNPEGIFNIFHDLLVSIDGWIYWLALIGILVLVGTIWWDLDYFFKTRKLKNLIDTSSKAKFLKSLDDIEYLAWRLPKKYKNMVVEKKIELKITK